MLASSPPPIGPRASVATILLAAGLGGRLGGPKALLLVRGGAPLIEAQCRARLASESARALAVLRPDVAALTGERLRAAGAEVVVSHAPDALGPAGSLAAAAAYLAAHPGPDIAIVTPVDVAASAATAAALVRALAGPPHAGSPLAAVPRHAGRKGHPVALRTAALARYLEPDPPPLRDHLRALGADVTLVDVDDPWILEDLDHAHQTDVLARITGAEPGPAAVPRFFRGDADPPRHPP